MGADAWALARRLVVDEGATYAEAAAAAGVPLSTLQKRAAAECWRGERQQAADYGALCRSLRAELARQALEAVQAKQAPAAFLDALFKADRLAARGSTIDPRVRLAAGADFLELLVRYLSENAPAVLTQLEPHIQSVATAWEATCAG